MTDIIIPLKKDELDNIEVKYTLRSICKYMPERGKIFIIGHLPDFVKSIIHIEATDQEGGRFKQRNIFNKLTMGCGDDRVSESFTYFAGDEYLLKPYKQEYYHIGTLEESVNRYKETQTYRQTLLNTFTHLNYGYDFDNHWPILMNKASFSFHLACLPWHIAYGFAHKSIYCNQSGISGKYKPIPKIKAAMTAEEIREFIKDAPGFSTQERSLNGEVLTVLDELFPEKCMYEL